MWCNHWLQNRRANEAATKNKENEKEWAFRALKWNINNSETIWLYFLCDIFSYSLQKIALWNVWSAHGLCTSSNFYFISLLLLWWFHKRRSHRLFCSSFHSFYFFNFSAVRIQNRTDVIGISKCHVTFLCLFYEWCMLIWLVYVVSCIALLTFLIDIRIFFHRNSFSVFNCPVWNEKKNNAPESIAIWMTDCFCMSFAFSLSILFTHSSIHT